MKNEDEIFARKAVETSTLSAEQLQLLLARQREESDSGKARSLKEIALESGLLTQQQVEAILPQHPETKEPLKSIAGFELLEPLGKGAMASVFKAKQSSLNRTVALKLMRPELTLETTLVQRFLTEARAVARLDHPNIVRAFLLGEAEGYHYLAMEYVQGEDLRSRLRRERVMAEREVVHIGTQICRALHHAHQHGIIHRDVKPGNILYIADSHDRGSGEYGLAKLADLGLAHWKEMETGQLTQHGDLVGTASYIAPEQVRTPSGVDRRVDIYSLGACLYHMVCGRPPYTGRITELLVKHANEPLPDPREFNPAISAPLCGVLRRALEKLPHKRFQTAAEFAAGLEEVLHHHKLSVDLPPAGGYQFTRMLTADSLGKTYEAVHVNLKQNVCIRVINSSHIQESGTLDRLFDYIRAIGSLRRSGIPPVRDCGLSSKGFYVITDQIEGNDILKANLTQMQVLETALEIARLLKALQDMGLCHGRLDPTNVILDSNGKPWLLEPALRAALHLEASRKEKYPIDRTRYDAPELRLADHEPDVISDIYSLGIILDDLARSAATASTDLDDALEAIDAASEINSLVKRMTSGQPKERLGSADALAAAIKETMDTLRADQFEPEQAPPMAPQQRAPTGKSSSFTIPSGSARYGPSLYTTQELPSIGSSDIEPNVDSGIMEAQEAPMPGQSSGGTVRLQVRTGPARGKVFEIPEGGSITFGRVEGEGVMTLGDPAISSTHCTISHQDGKIVLTDHASMNGTYLNRERVETKEVVAGDKIQIGRTIMKVQ